MSKVWIIARKETRAFFNSPATYIVLVVFLILNAWFFTSSVFINAKAEMRSLFDVLPMIYLFFIPAITMGLIAREKNSGTLEVLTTLPLKESEIVLGKYIASLSILVVGLIFTVIHLFTIMLFGQNLDYGSILFGYLGMFFLGAVYCAIGIFGSALHSNQIVAFIISFAIVFVFFVFQYILYIMPGSIAGIIQYLSFGYHTDNFSRGVIDTRDIIYFMSLIVIFLRLAIMMLETRKAK
ncbi:MAG TPA: ABC transporter permease subunit [Candidatus Cloacimonadota bacterium]|nr:ABC transporter permease subunit [Candidatus Cloacimonadota bacterium]HPT72648.1 ABC transporter permease subunit [Candidatus Cloacimonadota bacterium]